MEEIKKIFKIRRKKCYKSSQKINSTSNFLYNYKKQEFITRTHILKKDYTEKATKIILIKSLNQLIEELIAANKKTNCIRLYVGYQNDNTPSLKLTFKFPKATNNYSEIIKIVLKNYNLKVSKNDTAQRIGISFNKLGGNYERNY